MSNSSAASLFPMQSCSAGKYGVVDATVATRCKGEFGNRWLAFVLRQSGAVISESVVAMKEPTG